MNNELIKTSYSNEEIVFKIENGISFVRIDEVAKFCGWSYTKEDRGDKEFIRWNTVNKFATELGLSHEVATGDFIPEFIMYALVGKAKNDKATQFMLWVGQVLTEIRKTGKYDTIEHEIMKIEDEKERQLTLAVYKLKELLKIDKDELTALRLENKEHALESYKQNKKLKELEMKVEDASSKVNDMNDKISKATVLREGDMGAEAIAKKFNVFSTTGKPHNRFADNMARVLGFYVNPEGNSGLQNDYISVNLTTRGGITVSTLKYSKLAYEEMKKYINENGLHIENPATYYKRKCKGGNVGDFNFGRIIFDEIEECIKINKITYDLYNSSEYEE